MFYIYEVDTNNLIAVIDTDDFDDIEFDYDWDIFGATETPLSDWI